MNKIFNGELLDIANQIINNKQSFDLLVLDLNNIEYNQNYDEYIQKLKDILSISSYLIKNGSNIIVIGNDKIKDIDIDFILYKELLWDKHRTIIYKTKLKEKDLLSSEYNSIFWYSNNYRPNDPIPICNNFQGNDELSDFWNIDIDIYKRIIQMFSNENNMIFGIYTNNEIMIKYCNELNRNYIGLNNE